MGTLWSDVTHNQGWGLGVQILYPLVPSVLGTLWAGTLASPSMAWSNLIMGGRSRKLEILTLMVNDTHFLLGTATAKCLIVDLTEEIKEYSG